MSTEFTTANAWGSEAPANLADTIRKLAIDLRPEPMLAPGSLLLVSPPDFKSLLTFAEPEPLWPKSVMSAAWRYSPRLAMLTAICDGGPTRYELRLGPYEDVAEPWCVVKNLDTGRRETHDWPLPSYIADHLTRAA